MRLALGNDLPPDASRLYFRRISWWLSNALAAFHHGIDATQVAADFTFDDTFRLVDEAVAKGRGAVVASPHWCGHELMAALLNKRHPMTFVVRQASTDERMARKLKWYAALGVEVLVRPRHASAIKDAAAYLRVLKQGRILAITPDLLAPRDEGIEVRLFGRSARIFAGAFTIASAARSPLLLPHLCWQSDSRVICGWSLNEAAPRTKDRNSAIANSAQEWCRWFEGKLQNNPQDWLFWLDKRWSRFLRETPVS